MIGKTVPFGLLEHAVVTRKGIPQKGDIFISGNPPTAYEAYADMSPRECWLAEKVDRMRFSPDDIKNCRCLPQSPKINLLEVRLSEFIANNCEGMNKAEVVTSVSNLLKKIEAI
jgi:hypothetical protein